MATTFDVVAEPTRRRILDLLRERPRPVGELVSLLGLTQPGVSKHLRVLRQAKLVRVRREAQRQNGGTEVTPVLPFSILSGYEPKAVAFTGCKVNVK